MAIILQLAITLSREDADSKRVQSNEYCYAGGLVEYVKWLNTDKVCDWLCLKVFF